MDFKAVLVPEKSTLQNRIVQIPVSSVLYILLRPRQALGHCYATVVAPIFTMTLYREISDGLSHIS